MHNGASLDMWVSARRIPAVQAEKIPCKRLSRQVRMCCYMH